MHRCIPACITTILQLAQAAIGYDRKACASHMSASNNSNHTRWSLYCCLFAPHTHRCYS